MTEIPDRLECELLVLGAGMAGLTAASIASRAGARVVVVERAPVIGGSAAVSTGYLWTAENIGDLAEIDPRGDRALQQVVVDEFPTAVELVRRTGVYVSEQIPVLDGVGHQIDITGYLDRCRAEVLGSGGSIVLEAEVQRLDVDDAGVVGARVIDKTMTVAIRAPWTLSATGGFAQDPDLLAEQTDPWACHMRARAGRWCRGDGLRLALAAGAGRPVENQGFYGHLVAWKVSLDDPERWDNFTLLHSRASLLVDERGGRFTDETRGDNISAEATVTAARGRAMLIWDEAIHDEFVLQSWPPGNAGIDKFQVALQNGGVGKQCADLDTLCAFAGSQGFDRDGIATTVAEFNARVAQDAPSNGRKQGVHRPLTHPPFFALVVEPTVTFPFAGIRTDTAARVLTNSGSPLPGLLAAGVDVGNVYREGYAGGLALAASFGIRAMRTAGFA